MPNVFRGKNPVSWHLFIDCSYHIHLLPKLLKEMDHIHVKFDVKQQSQLLARFAAVYGAAGVDTLFRADLITENEMNTVNQKVAGGIGAFTHCSCEPLPSIQEAMWV